MDGADMTGATYGPPPLPGLPPVKGGGRVAVTKVPGAKLRSAKPAGLFWAGLAGFVAGAVCWHFVGFWGFMTEAVFYARGDAPVKGAQRMAGAPAKNQSRQPGAVANAAASANCSLAVMDRAGGDVQTKGCEGHAFKYHPARNIVRADRGDFGPTPVPTLISGEGIAGAAVGGWSARIEPDMAGAKGKKAE